MKDRVILGTVAGAMAYLEDEVRRAATSLTVHERRPDALVADVDIPDSVLAEIPFYSSAAVSLEGLETYETSWPDAIEQSLRYGLLSTIVAADPLRFRIGQLPVDRWDVRDWLAARFGWHNSANDWQVNLEPDRLGAALQVGRFHTTARFGALRRLPASTTPVIAAVLCRLAKLTPGDRVLDPFCGAGTNLLLTAAAEPTATLVGCDIDPRAVEAATANLATRSVRATVVLADARRVPLPDKSVDKIVSNIPFGKRVGSHAENVELYPAVLRELARLLAPRGRAVLLTEDKRLLKETVQRTRGLRIVKEVQFESGGAHPSAYVLTHVRASRRQTS